MDITLPRRTGGKDGITLRGVKQLTVIGANGAGKTRLVRSLMASSGAKAFAMSALRATIPSAVAAKPAEGSIDALYLEASSSTHIIQGSAASEFDRLMYLLLYDEFVEMLRYKRAALSDSRATLAVTKLDIVTRSWEKVFPGNRMLREGGQLLFTSDSGDDSYSAGRLSDGERAVMYYIGAALYAPREAAIFIDDPGVFIHPSMMTTLWNAVEQMRPDCIFIYNTSDPYFASSRLDNRCVWVKSYDAATQSWDYEVVGSQNLSEQLFIDLLGTRKPVLFIEGDSVHSIDAKLYPLVFREYTVKPLGSCDKVIETTRSFSDLTSFHHLDSYGIVDRDRRNEKEVNYLRGRKILVPEVAEIENMLLLPDIVAAIAQRRKRDGRKVLARVQEAVINMFSKEMKAQVLEHVRHYVKRSVEYHADGRFTNITAIENHLRHLVDEIKPRDLYDSLTREFSEMLAHNDYTGILRVYNQKQILADSRVAQLCGFVDKHEYLRYLLNTLKSNDDYALRIRNAVRRCFLLPPE